MKRPSFRQIKRYLLLSLLTAGVFNFMACRPPASSQPGTTIYFVPNAKKMISLSFDDGPNGIVTANILDILRNFNVRANFFLLGANAISDPEIVKRMAREGHLICNHGFAHQRFDQLSAEAIQQDILASERVISEITGIKPTWLRPPYGINGVGLEDFCRAHGLTIAGWSTDANDWNPHSKQELFELMISQVTAGDIILLHDGHDAHPDVPGRRYLPVILGPILERLIAAGFHLVTLDELTRHAEAPLAQFANGVRLLSLDIQDKPIYPGSSAYIRYFWDRPPDWDPEPCVAFVHFNGPKGYHFQDDHYPPVAHDVRDLRVKRVLKIPTNAVPGSYQIQLGLCDPACPTIARRVAVRSSLACRKGAVIIPNALEIRASAPAAP